MQIEIEQPIVDFYGYPPIGEDDWEFAFATARVRALETNMLSRGLFLDMAQADDLAAALDLLSSTEYSINSKTTDFTEIEQMLLEKRSETRQLFKQIMTDEELITLLLEKGDFANLRLALRRKLTDKPIGTDYSNDGSVSADEFEQIFETENYSPLPIHMQEAIEAAVLAYYEKKDVRRIDLAIDNYQNRYLIESAIKLNSVFLKNLFAIRADLLNIRTLLRLKMTGSEERDVFFEGGFIGIDVLRHGLALDYEAIGALFAGTPYYELIDSGVGYLDAHGSFLKLESNCERYVRGFLRQSRQITAGLQPAVAYLLLKEAEIRTLRLILTGKKNGLDKQLLLDRLEE